jgi:hypothetical protein
MDMVFGGWTNFSFVNKLPSYRLFISPFVVNLSFAAYI